MPASEETYRNQRPLHIIFGLSSAAMAVVILWMIIDDHTREWKETQREFRQVELAKLESQREQAQRETQRQYQDEIAAIEAQIADAEETIRNNAEAIREQEAKIKELEAVHYELDTKTKFQKAELDSQRSLYDGMVKRGETRKAATYLREVIEPSQEKLDRFTAQLQTAERRLQEARDVLNIELRANIVELERERDRLQMEVERIERSIQQNKAEYFGPTAWLRDLPFLDLAAPATQIEQLTLPELTIDYNFKEVPRYDRCQTCHLGIDRIGFDTDADGDPMPQPFASHPYLTHGATSIDPSGKEVEAGLYLDSNGPHPINDFGCTICHEGQGSGTSFSYASHTPDSLEEQHRWEEEYGWFEVHHWDYPMRPTRFTESSCLKCHHEVTDIPQAETLQAGYDRIVTYGCTGCHTIGGEAVLGPDLTDAPKTGPNLGHIASKVDPEWMARWLKNPHAFRPDSRMPRFYGNSNNFKEDDQPYVDAEIHAMVALLRSEQVSSPVDGFFEPGAIPDSAETFPELAEADAVRGRELFLSKGCMACHSHKEFPPESFPEEAQRYAQADHGPNLSDVAAKFASPEDGYLWLANWIHDPEAYHPKSLMPNLEISWEDASDLAAWLVSVEGTWTEPVEVRPLDAPEVQDAIDELVELFQMRAGTPLLELGDVVAEMTLDEKLLFLGERTIGRYGCFGCHDIPGFEDYKPIGTPLSEWGLKSPTRLDFGHVVDYLEDHHERTDDGEDVYDGTSEYYFEQLAEHTREGFLYQKLHRPRSFDYKKTGGNLKAWDERLRMPKFSWADDTEAIEEIMTFVLGLTGENVNPDYLPHKQYEPRQLALAHGRRVLDRYNCKGCHVLEMPKYVIPEGTRVAEAAIRFDQDVSASKGPQGRGLDYLEAFYPELVEEEQSDAEPPPDDGSGRIVIEGMPLSYFRDDLSGENELIVQLWRPVTILGHAFNTGDRITIDPSRVEEIPPVGGDFAWLYTSTLRQGEVDEEAGYAEIVYNIEEWNNLPPPLLREGLKVQTPWLTRFLQDPHTIRPITNLRMPRFHYQEPGTETRRLADYFAAVDRAEFPYQELPQLSPGYLAEREREYPNYLEAGWHLMAGQGSACLQCHSVGSYEVQPGPDVVVGPHLNQVHDRFRPDYLAEWLANPSRLLPYTKMPQNIPVEGTPALAIPSQFEDAPHLDLIEAIRDTLMNYPKAVEQRLAASERERPAQPVEAAEGGEE